MSNIIKFGRRPEQPNAIGSQPHETPKDGSKDGSKGPELTFEEIVRRNLENAERLRIERDKANKNVLRSYRIK
jgi:hypothetical protein